MTPKYNSSGDSIVAKRLVNVEISNLNDIRGFVCSLYIYFKGKDQGGCIVFNLTVVNCEI